MTAEHHRDEIKRHADALYALTQDTPPPPTDEWVPTPPNLTLPARYWPTDPGVRTVWARDQPDGSSWIGEGAGPHMQRLSGFDPNWGRDLLENTNLLNLVIQGHANALDEISLHRCELRNCQLLADHYPVFGGPLDDVRCTGVIFSQQFGRETPVRIDGADHLLIEDSAINAESGLNLHGYNKSPIRIQGRLNAHGPVRLSNVDIIGGSAIHIGLGSENLIGGSNGYDPNPIEHFEDRGGVFRFSGFRPNEQRECYRFTGLQAARLVDRIIRGAPRDPWNTILISVHHNANRVKPPIEIENVRYEWEGGGFDVTQDHVRYVAY